MFAYDPYGFRCCQHNVAFAWPYFAEHLWMATPDKGLAAAIYAPCEVEARVGDGTTVTIKEKTDYPFGETVDITIHTPKPVRFPLYLRIPGWCERPLIGLNGDHPDIPDVARGWAVIDRKWSDNDTILFQPQMEIKVKRWEKNRNTASVYRGPLIYSLKIGERWEKYGGSEKWPGFEVFPTTPWNYGLVLDSKNPSASFEFDYTSHAASSAEQPFAANVAPVSIRTKGRRIPQWKLESNGLIEEVQPSPVKSGEPVEEITLIPMGCARLRVTAFPVIGEGPDAVEWKE
jgi:hypothetical protein